MQAKIDAAETELVTLKNKMKALQKLHDTIQGRSCFNDEEKIKVETALEECKVHIEEKDEYLTTHRAFLVDTVNECTTNLKEREEILNQAFSSPELTEFQDLMHMFKSEHNDLRNRLRMVTEDNQIS